MFDIETSESDLDIDGQRVDVYKNLQDECLSIKSRNTDSDDYGTVIGHAEFVLLSDVEFVIQHAGQERARENGVKNVHAVVRGTVKGVGSEAEMRWNMMVHMFANDLCNVTYDPFETDTFEVSSVVRKNDHDVVKGDEIHEATYASVTENGVGAMLPSYE